MNHTLAAALIALPCIAQAQVVTAPRCGPVNKLASVLEQRYQEFPRSRAMTSYGQMLIVYRNADDSSWTMAAVSPKGKACVLSAGKFWDEIAPPVAGEAM